MIEKADAALIGELYGRTAEMAIRLATIHAVSRAGLDAKITHADLSWGRELSVWSANTLAREAALRIGDTQAQRDANLILRTIHEAGGQISNRDLQRKLRCRLTKVEFDGAIRGLVDGDFIETQMRTRAQGGGRQSAVYLLRSA